MHLSEVHRRDLIAGKVIWQDQLQLSSELASHRVHHDVLFGI